MKRAYSKTITTLLAVIITANAHAAEVIYTVKGTINDGQDYLKVFGLGKAMPKATPFMLVFTFEDSKGIAIRPRCSNAGSGLQGRNEQSPGIAVLTIGNTSYVFGRKPEASSSAWRGAGACDGAEITASVSDGRGANTVSIRLQPPSGTKVLTTDADWRTPLSLSKFIGPAEGNSFSITRTGNYGLSTRGTLKIESVTISGAEAEEK